MSKGLGQKIAIKFTEDLVGDVSGVGQVSNKLSIISATASSQFSNDYKPDFAIDGNFATMWASLNKTGTQYIQFDLGSSKKIEKIKAMCGSGYIPETFNILVSSDGNNFTTVSTGRTISVADTLVEFTFTAIDCRYVRLVMTSSGNSNFYALKEFEVYSAEVGNASAFTVTGKEYQYVNGSLIPKEYKAISVEKHPDYSDDKHLLVTLHPQSRFNNVEGPLTVQYDHTKGSLRGRGGPVDSFTETFIPTDLEPKPNPHVAENIEVSAEANVSFTKVTYNQRYADEQITVSASAAVDFIYVGIINP